MVVARKAVVLGSTRLLTSGTTGKIKARYDYRPFGEELGAGISGRMTAMGYSSATETLKQKYTGYERDSETDLDFAQARYFSAKQGRFTSHDPYNIMFEKEKGKDVEEIERMLNRYLSEPQAWNRYSYTLNNPLKYTDPDGRQELTTEERQNIQKLRDQAQGKSAEDAKSVLTRLAHIVNWKSNHGKHG